MFYRQCKLQKLTKTSSLCDVSFVPDEFAILDNVLKIKKNTVFGRAAGALLRYPKLKWMNLTFPTPTRKLKHIEIILEIILLRWLRNESNTTSN